MTTRVQKGGPIFKPVAKARARQTASAPRQASTPADTPSSSQIGHAAVNGTLSSIPPPSNQVRIDAPELSSIQGGPNTPTPSSNSAISTISFELAPHPPIAPPVLINSQPVVNKLATATSRPLNTPPQILSQPRPANKFSPGNIPAPVPQTTTGPFPPMFQVPNPPVIASDAHMSVFQVEATTPIPLGPPAAIAEQNAEPSVEKKKRGGSRGSNVTTGDNEPDKPQRQRKRAKIVDSRADGHEATTEPTSKKRKRANPSEAPHSGKSRVPSVPLFDPEADPGEEIDPTLVTMAALCSDTGQGRVSSKAAEIQNNHAAWKAQNKEKRARMKTLSELKKYGRDEEGETDMNQTDAPIPSLTSSTAVGGTPVEDESGNGFDYSQDLATSRFNVQVRIGPNGETIIDEESLVVDRNDEVDMGDYTHVMESDNTKFVNSGSYGKRYRGSRWSKDETESFYHALSQYGENYELIAYVLPGRDRKSCKNKFKAEDKKNPDRINQCLNNRIPVDVQALSRMTGKDFSGPVPVIRAPVSLTLAEPENPVDPETNNTSSRSVKKRSSSRNLASADGVEIVGDADTFNQDVD